MRHRALFLAAFAAAGVVLLTACTSSEEEIAQDVRAESSGGAGSGDVWSADSSTVQPDAPQDAGAGASDTPDVRQQDDAGQGEEALQTESAAAEGTSAGTAPTEEAPAETDGSQEVQTEASDVDAAGMAAEDIWSGTYASDQETVTISLIDEGSFSFAFANSGIASVAELDGTTAVYRGDDHHIVVFEMSEGVLYITVSSEEDYDASASPLNGMYVRQSVTSDTGRGEEET